MKGPGKSHAVYVSAATQATLMRAAYERCGEGEHVEAVMAEMADRAVRALLDTEPCGCRLTMRVVCHTHRVEDDQRRYEAALRSRNNAALRDAGLGEIADADEAKHPQYRRGDVDLQPAPGYVLAMPAVDVEPSVRAAAAEVSLWPLAIAGSDRPASLADGTAPGTEKVVADEGGGMVVAEKKP